MIGFGVALGQMAWEADWKRVRPATLGVGPLGILQLIALVRYPGDLDWAAVQTWVYVAVVASFVALGVRGWRVSESGRTHGTAALATGAIFDFDSPDLKSSTTRFKS